MLIGAEQWPALSRLLDEALGLGPVERGRFLEALPAEARALAPELRRLLECHARAETSDFLGELRLELPLAMRLEAPAPLGAGATVGPYTIEAEAGRGGMGVVYRARRSDGLLKRPVALKLLHATRYDAASLARFARERDILAGLVHPGIARLYDAGTTAAQQPYLALEYVEGTPLGRYCDDRQLGIEARLALFAQVLAAVQYAHANLVVHRDLKPSNILVTAAGEVRLLDFGIAKLVAGRDGPEAAPTEVGGRALTPDYASPEQVRGETVSIASDVYSLGVVLYELLSGRRPYAPVRRSAGALEEAIAAGEPVPLGAAAVGEAEAAARGTSPAALRRVLRGDLEPILGKALRAEPAERYATVDAFAEDLARYRRGEAVRARPEGRWRRSARFLRRYRVAVGVTLAVVAALAAGLTVALWQARRANEEARVARAVQGFLQDVFGANSKAQSNPARAQATTARELLDAGAAKVGTALADSPEAQIEVLETLGAMYHDLGLDERAVDLLTTRVALARRVYGPNDTRLAQALRDLSLSLEDTNRVQQRPAVLAEALAILDRAGDTRSALRANVLGDLAQLALESDLAKALAYAHASRLLMEGRPPSQDVQEALVMEGTVLNALGRYAEGEGLLARAVEVSKRAFGDPNPHLPHVEIYLAEARYFLGDFAGAERAYRDAFQGSKALLGPDHVDVMQTEARLGLFLGRTGRNREGLALLREAHERASATLPADDASNLPSIRELYGWELARAGDLEGGYALLAQASAAFARRFPDTSWVLSALERTAYVEVDRGHYGEAHRLLEESTRVRTALKDESSFPNGNPAGRLHLALAEGDWDAAAAAIAHLRVVPAPPGALSLTALEQALAGAELRGRRGDAAGAAADAGRLLGEIRAAREARYLGGQQARAERTLGLAQLALGRPAQAEAPLAEALGLDRALFDPALSLEAAADGLGLAQSLAALGRQDEARTRLAEAEAILKRHPQLGAHWQRTAALARAALAQAGRSASAGAGARPARIAGDGIRR
ncbi:MAG: serine/threonine protein kinase [Proteobacteria bacterium]|nr:serine/threonine protein kinase [Pseudomonadota bacterium]